MASKLANMPIGRLGLGERELLLVAAAFLSPKDNSQPPPLDWIKFTRLCGYGSTDSARVCFRPLQKKLREFIDNIGDDSGSSQVLEKRKSPRAPRPPRTPRTPGSGTSEMAREAEAPGSELKAGGNPRKRKLHERDIEVPNEQEWGADWKYDDEYPGGRDVRGHGDVEKTSGNSTVDGI